MPRALVLKFRNKDIICTPEKVDRSKLYGFIDVEALDSKGRKCTLATLAEDGRTIVGIGGSAFGVLSPDGEWLENRRSRPSTAKAATSSRWHPATRRRCWSARR